MNNQKMRDHIENIRTIDFLSILALFPTLWAGVYEICDIMSVEGLMVAVYMLASYASLLLAHNMIAGYTDMLEATLLTYETNAKILDCLQNKNGETKQETQSENVDE